ncbi:hypothetical protein ACO0QE_002477 [Hanseniaspora vineae]
MSQIFSRTLKNPISRVYSRPLSPQICSPFVLRCYSNGGSADYSKIKTLDDLAKLKSIDDVPPEIIRKLILEKTEQLNAENEIQLLKELRKEEEYRRSSTFAELKAKYTRPLWNLFLMSSSIYLFYHWIWLKLDYEELENDKKQELQKKEEEFNNVIAAQLATKSDPHAKSNKESLETQNNGTRTKKYWLF